jgi:type I restriction-modification system DNA methylase subunit
MKLPEHVDNLRNLIESAFDKQFARLGFGSTKQINLERLPPELHSRRRRFEEMLQSHQDETGSYEMGREKLVDELTFTLFNRIAAVKVMEAANLFPPVITKETEHGDRSFGHKAWLEIRPDMRSEELEGIREYIMHAFNELGESLPLYSRSYPYALLPDPISLNEIIDAFNAVQKDPQVEDDIWQSDDVLGWLYESYNNVKKAAFKESKAKTEYDKVSLQSQVYTPRWVVQFLVDNSLGKLYLEMYPDSEIKDQYKIANAPQTQERKRKPLDEVKLFDPACGSGNFLLYAFDLFYELYLDQIENYGADYDEDNIPQLIVEHNLHGIDLDDRAVQLAQLGLYIKARKRRRNIPSLQFNLVSSDFYLPEYGDARHIFEEGANLNRNQKALIAEIWGDLQLAYKFGSLIRLDEKLNARMSTLVAKREKIQPEMFSDSDLGVEPEQVQRELFLEGDIEQERAFAASFFSNLKTAVVQYALTADNDFLASRTRDAVTFLELLNTKYDVATANPPYTSRGDYGPDLKAFIDINYRDPYDTYINLYACFLQRLDQLLIENGKMAMVTPMTFMFISSFEDTRKLILTKYHINLFVQFGFGGMFSESVDPAMFILDKGKTDQESTFFKFDMYFSDSKLELFSDALEDVMKGAKNQHVFTLNQERIREIVSHPFIFWISQEFRDKFNSELLENFITIRQGIATGNNMRFLRYFWEISPKYQSKTGEKYIGYAKGGKFNRWAGNLWLTIDFSEGSYKILSKSGNCLPSKQYYFKEGITYSASGRGGYAFRYLPKDHVFDVGGSSMFITNAKSDLFYILAFLNSKLSFYIADCLNPTANIQVGDLKRVPFVQPSIEHENIVAQLAKENIRLTNEQLEFSIVEPGFNGSPLSPDYQWLEAVKIHITRNFFRQALVLLNEAVISEKIFSGHSLSSEDKSLVIAKQGDDVANYPITKQGKSFFISIYANKISDHTSRKIEELPVATDPNENIQEIIPLILKGTGLEEISKKYFINPIDVLFVLRNIPVSQFTRGHAQELAFEFLVDVIRDILMEDEDGIIPLVPNAGEKILLDRIEDKFQEKGFSMAQYSQFETVLGKSLNEQLKNHFFVELSDHLNLFSYLPKTPFIWHLSSGPEQGFDCYLIIYKWSRDKLMRIRSVYLERRERSLVNRQSDLAGNESADAQNEKDKIFKQLKEIESFKEKIDELLAEGYDPILDDGVGKNIAPLQKKKMIPYEVLNPGQLKKYLNADW